MGQNQVALWTETSSDPELIAGVRAGDSAAFGVLYERHADAARKVAAQYTNAASDIDDVVSESFSRVLRALQQGDGPDLAFRAYLFTIVRRTGMDLINKGIRTRPRDDMSTFEDALGYEASSDEPAMAGFEQSLVADAFKSLPERWQAVLWYTEVEKKSPKEIAPLLGLTANGVAALSYRAREALRQAYLQQHLTGADEVDCIEVNTQLGAYVRGGLSKREASRVDSHVQVCAKCAALIAELEDVNRGMRAVIAPLVLGAAGLGALEGGLPIGGAFATGGAAAGGTGAGAGAGAGAGSGGGVAAGAGGAAAIAAAGAAAFLTSGGAPAPVGASATAAGAGAGAAGAAGAGTGAGAAVGAGAAAGAGVGAGTGGILAGAGALLLPAAAVVGVASVAIAGAGFFGAIGGDPSGGANSTPQAQTGPISHDDATDNDSGSTSGGDDATTTPTVAPSEPATEPADETPGTDGVADAPSGGTGSTGGTGTSGGGSSSGSTGTGDTGSGTGTGDTGTGDTGTGDTGTGDTGSGTGDTGTGDTGGSGVVTPATPAALLSLAKAPLDYLEIPHTNPRLGMSLSNSGDAAADDITAQITLPAGLTFSPPPGGAAALSAFPAQRLSAYMTFATTGEFIAGDWTCTYADGDAIADCTLTTLGAGGSSRLELPVIVGGALSSDASTTFRVASGDQSIDYSVLTGVEQNEEDVDVVYSDEGHLAAVHVGATLMGCDQTDLACAAVMSSGESTTNGSANNNSWAMLPLNEAGGVSNSSTSVLQLPEGAHVTYASLEWAANRYSTDNFSGALDAARLRAPGQADYADITADTVSQTYDPAGRVYYQARADVTDLVNEYGSGEWSVADIALAATRNDPDRTYFGGWALTIVYSDPTLANSRVALFDGSEWVSTGDKADFTFSTDAQATVTLGWTAWEGDRALIGDQIDVDGDTYAPMRWDGTQSFVGDSGNAADSTATGGLYANALGVDVKLFRPGTVPAGVHAVTVSSSGDNFLLSTLTVTISYDE